MGDLRAQFVRRSAARIETATAVLARLRETPADRQQLQELMRFFHSLSGVGTSFGFPHVTALAKEGELGCLAFLHGEAAPSAAEIENWSSLVGALAHALRQQPDAPRSAGPVATRAPEVFLVSSDTSTAATLIPLLEPGGVLDAPAGHESGGGPGSRLLAAGCADRGGRARRRNRLRRDRAPPRACRPAMWCRS